jgi:hypothetical protein
MEIFDVSLLVFSRHYELARFPVRDVVLGTAAIEQLSPAET